MASGATREHAGPGAEATDATRRFWIGLARAFGGAVIFSLPMLMTMEMWWLGFAMDRLRLALLAAISLPLLVGLSHVSGFEETFELVQDVVDALVAYAVGFLMGAAGLTLVGALGPGMSLDEVAGKLTLMAIPGGIGALLAQSQLGGESRDAPGREQGPSGYHWELFLMAVGALFLAFNVAPTEEMVLIAYRITPWHVLAVVVTSLLAMHGFVYAMEFHGQEALPSGTPWWSAFLRFTVPGYAVALLISAFVLWTFGRLDHTSLYETAATVLVLGFPAAIGAAAARLVL